MFKKAILYPFLFILYGILNPLLFNLDQVDPSQAVRPLLILVLISSGLILILRFVFKNWQYAGYLTFLFLAFLFFSGHSSQIIQDLIPSYLESASLIAMLFWGISLSILGVKGIWLRIGGTSVLNPALNLILTFAVLSQVLLAAPKIIRTVFSFPGQGKSELIPETGASTTIDCQQRPDIYYLILDAYGRADVLEEQYGLDNQPFLEFLERKGFTVAGQSHSNYTQTIFSLASALNFKFIGPEPAGTSGQTYFTRLIAENELVALLQECGYRTVSFETGFSFTNNPQVDIYLASENRFNDFESLLLVDTPLEWLAEAVGWEQPEYSYESHRERVLDDFTQLKSLPEIEGPKFVFAHIISPHPPFVFDQNGASKQPGRSYSIGDGNDFRGTWDEYREGYANQVEFINRMLEETIESILTGSQTPPIIILQGDHGPGGHLDWSSPGSSCLWERTSILNAYYLPGGVSQPYATITPVNSFRVILNNYFGTDLELLPDKTFFTSHRLPRQVIDITDERESRANCSGGN